MTKFENMKPKTLAPLRASLLLLLACGLYVEIQICNASHHFCSNGLTTTFEMDDFYNRDETIVPLVAHEPLEKRMNHKRCTWHVTTDKLDENLQVVIQGLADTTDPESHDKPEAAMKVQASGKSTFSVTRGLFRVYPANQRRHFINEIQWDPKHQRRPSVNLRILVPLPDYCNRDMLGFNGSCYALSDVKQSLTDAMASIRGDAQLASFASLSEIRGFVAANRDRRRRHPYTRPLNLKQPVRLGIFCSGKSAVLSLIRNSSACELQGMERSEITISMASTRQMRPCAFLTVSQSDEAKIEFGDCGTPMRTLIMFPQRASPGLTIKDCHSETIVKTVSVLSLSLERNSKTADQPAQTEILSSSEPPSLASGDLIVPLSIGLAVAATLLIIPAAIAIWFFKRRLRRRNSELGNWNELEMVPAMVPMSCEIPTVDCRSSLNSSIAQLTDAESETILPHLSVQTAASLNPSTKPHRSRRSNRLKMSSKSSSTSSGYSKTKSIDSESETKLQPNSIQPPASSNLQVKPDGRPLSKPRNPKNGPTSSDRLSEHRRMCIQVACYE